MNKKPLYRGTLPTVGCLRAAKLIGLNHPITGRYTMENLPTQLQSFYKSFISFEFPLYLILLLLALILIAGIKVSKRREWQNEPLSLDASTPLKGFAAVSIIIHHLSQELADKAGPLEVFQSLGVLFVGFF